MSQLKPRDLFGIVCFYVSCRQATLPLLWLRKKDFHNFNWEFLLYLTHFTFLVFFFFFHFSSVFQPIWARFESHLCSSTYLISLPALGHFRRGKCIFCVIEVINERGQAPWPFETFLFVVIYALGKIFSSIAHLTHVIIWLICCCLVLVHSWESSRRLFQMHCWIQNMLWLWKAGWIKGDLRWHPLVCKMETVRFFFSTMKVVSACHTGQRRTKVYELDSISTSVILCANTPPDNFG